MNKAKVQVSIFDKTYTLISDESQEHLNKAAHFVDNCMREIAKAGVNDLEKIAVIVALQCASNTISANEKNELLRSEYDSLLYWLDQTNKELSEL